MYFQRQSPSRRKARRNLILYIILFLLVLGLYIALSYFENQG